MNDEMNEKNGFKPMLIIASVIVAAAAIFAVVFGIVYKSDSKNNLQSTTANSSKAVYTQTTAEAGDAVSAPKNDDIPQAISTTAAADRNDGSALPQGTASTLIKGAVATNRWSATSVISSVTAERVEVNLDEYEKGTKTGETKTRYMYVAKVNTRPSRLTFINSAQVTPKIISGMPAIVKGFESSTNEVVLFACSNEYCSRDSNNPNGNIYFNNKNNLEGTVIKNGTLAQQGKSSVSLTINQAGDWQYPVRVSLSTSENLIKLGTINSVSYTYPVIWEGQKYYPEDTGIAYDIRSDFQIAPKGNASFDRTLIGKIDDNNYVFLISEGFSGGYLVDYMLNSLGAKYAYWGAGGYATGMYIKDCGVITSNNYIAHGDLFCVK